LAKFIVGFLANKSESEWSCPPYSIMKQIM